MRAERAAAILVCLTLAGCRSARQAPPAANAVTASSAQQVEAIVRQALALDAAGDRGADTLYAPDAITVANARLRMTGPRFAGIGPGGRVAVAALAVTLHGRFAWVMVDYRWVNAEQRLAEVGRATLVCEQRPTNWRIVHVHSSQPLPWER